MFYQMKILLGWKNLISVRTCSAHRALPGSRISAALKNHDNCRKKDIWQRTKH